MKYEMKAKLALAPRWLNSLALVLFILAPHPTEGSRQVNLFQFLALSISSRLQRSLVASTDDLNSQQFYHGARLELRPGDLLLCIVRLSICRKDVYM